MNQSSAIKNIIWKFSERIAAQLVTFAVSIILARLLSPEDYGIVSIVTIFIAIANVFVSDGFGTALIQKKDSDSLDFSSVLFFNIAISILLYAILYIVSPWISNFYGDGYEILTPVFRVLGLRIIVIGVNSVQQAYISKNMQFKKFFWATLIGTILSAIIGISMALMGYGVWALVAQYLTNTFVNTVVLFFVAKLKIIPQISFLRLKNLISYGYKILLSKLLITGFQEMRALIIGKLYSSADLAYYDKGKQIPNILVTNIDTSIGAVLFPKLANDQDDVTRIKTNTQRSVRLSSYIMSPLMLGLLVVSESLVKILLTDKWIACVPFMQFFAFLYLFQPIHTANLQAIKAIGQSGIFLKLEIIKKSLEVIVLLFTMWYGVLAIIIGECILTVLFIFVNGMPNTKLIGYALKEQFRDIFSPILMALIMMVIIFPFYLIFDNPIVQLIAQVFVGAFVYILLSIVCKNKEFTYIKNVLFANRNKK